MQIAVGPLIVVEGKERFCRDHGGDQPLGFVFGARAPVHSLGLTEACAFLDPGKEPGMRRREFIHDPILAYADSPNHPNYNEVYFLIGSLPTVRERRSPRRFIGSRAERVRSKTCFPFSVLQPPPIVESSKKEI